MDLLDEFAGAVLGGEAGQFLEERPRERRREIKVNRVVEPLVEILGGGREKAKEREWKVG